MLWFSPERGIRTPFLLLFPAVKDWLAGKSVWSCMKGILYLGSLALALRFGQTHPQVRRATAVVPSSNFPVFTIPAEDSPIAMPEKDSERVEELTAPSPKRRRGLHLFGH